MDDVGIKEKLNRTAVEAIRELFQIVFRACLPYLPRCTLFIPSDFNYGGVSRVVL